MLIPGKQKGSQRDQKSADIAEIVPRIRQKSHRMEKKSRSELSDHKQRVQKDSKQKGAPLERLPGYLMMMVMMKMLFLFRHNVSSFFSARFPNQKAQISPSSGTRRRVCR